MALIMCRLCFKEKSNSFGIFTTKGFMMGLASAIRMHFLDEVSEDDIFPKFVCPECWTKLSDFNQFYNEVDEAKNLYLERSVKKEMQDDIEMSPDAGDAPNADDDVVSVKSEPMEFDFEGFEKEIEFEEAALEDQSPQKYYEYEYLETNEVNDENETQYSMNGGKDLSAPAVAVTPKDIDGKLLDTSLEHKKQWQLVTMISKGAPQIPKRMNMICGKCNLPVKTLSELIKHYQIAHKNERIQMICCNTKVRIQDLLDHMEYHKTPEKYRCGQCDRYFPLGKLFDDHNCTPKIAHTEFDDMLAQYMEIRCDVCGEFVRTLSGAIQHHWTTHKKGLHSVRCCDIHIELNELRDHVEYHRNPDKFKCNRCNKTFVLSKHLQNHQPLCKQNARQIPSIRVQSLKKPPETVRSLIERMKLNRSKHGNGSPQPLEKTSTPALIITHSNSVSTNENRHPALAERIRTMQKKGEHKCLVCGKEYETASGLQDHADRWKSRLHHCHECGKDYKTAPRLKEHMVKHTGEYLFDCGYCPKKFKFNSGIIRHEKTDHPIELQAKRASMSRVK